MTRFHHLGGVYTLSSVSIILLVLAVFLTIYRFYKHRRQFTELSKGEWMKYIFGFLLSLVITCAVVFAGIFVLKLYLSGWIYTFSRITLLILALLLGSWIFLKFIPAPIKSFYKN